MGGEALLLPLPGYAAAAGECKPGLTGPARPLRGGEAGGRSLRWPPHATFPIPPLAGPVDPGRQPPGTRAGGPPHARGLFSIGRAHVRTPITKAPFVCLILLEKQNTTANIFLRLIFATLLLTHYT